MTQLKKRILINDLKNIAEQHNGECLSEQYYGYDEKHKFKCEKGHIWKTTIASIKQNYWCPECSKTKKKNLEYCKKIAKERGGTFLSKTYKAMHNKYKWKCSVGHIWESDLINIVHGKTWCPRCNNSYGESLSKYIFEKIFNKEFNKIKPNWLKNNKDNNLEIDGYNEELKLGFEYNGIQHYQNIYGFDDFINMKNHDEIKQRICKEKNIVLIIIPYWIKYENLVCFIINELKQQKIYITKKIDVNINNVLLLCKNHKQKFKKSINKRGGKLIDIEYKNNNIMLTIKCNKSHIWTTSSDNIKNKWCPKCGRLSTQKKLSFTIKQAQHLAKQKNGECLSKIYKNAHTKMIWKCKNGHKWEQTYDAIRGGSWCPSCAGNKKLSLNQVKRLAQKYDGQCLSKIYKNAHTKMIWKCKNGHEWEQTYDIISRGCWCLMCKKTERKIKGDMNV